MLLLKTSALVFVTYFLNNCLTAEYLVQKKNIILQNLHQLKHLNKPIIAPCNVLYLSDFLLFQIKALLVIVIRIRIKKSFIAKYACVYKEFVLVT